MELWSHFRSKRVLIVGGAGFVGSTLAHLLLERVDNCQLTIVDNFLSADRSNLPSAAALIEGSIADDQVLKQIDDSYDYVFHLACYHGNQSSIHDPLADHANNLITSLKLFEHLHRFKRLEKVVYSGAGCALAPKTFDKAEASVEVEYAGLDADSPYSISKIVGEYYAKYYHKQHALPTVRARFQNVYGPREILGAGQWRGTPATVWRNVVPTFIYRALNGIPLEVDNGGIATRDFIYVEEVARGLLHCAAFGKAGEAYNIASGEETTILQLAEMIHAKTDCTVPIQTTPRRSWDHAGKRFGSTEKAELEIGFRSTISLSDGLDLAIAWTRDNMELIQSTIARHRDRMPELTARV